MRKKNLDCGVILYEGFIDNLRAEQCWRDVFGLMELSAWAGERKKKRHINVESCQTCSERKERDSNGTNGSRAGGDGRLLLYLVIKEVLFRSVAQVRNIYLKRRGGTF